jgi:hypothetical protein
MKTGSDTRSTAENEFGRAKHEIGPDMFCANGTAENVFGSAKHENGTRTLGTAEKESGGAKHENGTRQPRCRRKRVRESKI